MSQTKLTNLTYQQTPRGLIYLVEPFHPLLELIELHLLQLGYEVAGFANHETALDAFTSSSPRPSLLITNYGSPGFSGVELMNRCLELEPGLQVILCSGRADIPEKVRASPVRFRFLPKPYPLGVLDFTVRSLIGKSSNLFFGPAKNECN
jgi:DNA-binding NtrC family response regulator